MKFIREKTSSPRGFTLVEMLVVIAIIAVLVAIIIPTVTSATKRAKAAADAANLRTAIGEANVYLAEHGIPDNNQFTEEQISTFGTQSKSGDGVLKVVVYTDYVTYADAYFLDSDNIQHHISDYTDILGE
jgi:prepilin-type N-terminal cleavage/methylation domain-containing protein